MTPLIEFVKSNGLKAVLDLGIKVYEHPHHPLVGFKYDQIESPKAHPVVRWSRGTVLERDTWKLIAQPFVRFFNYGEGPTEDLENFDWSNCVTTTKEDGSLCILYFYDGDWHVNTSGSFAFGKYDQLKSETWRELFWRTFESCGGRKRSLETQLTYIFELCAPENKVVRSYSGKLFLLGVTSGAHEIGEDLVQVSSNTINIQRPQAYEFKSISEVEDYLREVAKTDPTFEGVVLKDKNGIRFKVKSASYVALHRLKENGGLNRTSRLIELALANEGDEVLLYFPEIRPEYEVVKKRLDSEFQALEQAWDKNKNAPDQKSFAMAIKDLKYSGILFKARRYGTSILELWSKSSNLVIKNWGRDGA